MSENFFYPLTEDKGEDQKETKKNKREERIQWLLPLGRRLWAENLFPTQIISDLASQAQDLFRVSRGTAREYANAAYRLLQAELSHTQE
jgi:hypothetical protein